MSESSPHVQSQPVFQYDVIAGMMDLIAEGEQAWLDLYKDLGVRPLEVVYEDLTSPDGYELTVRDVLRHLDLDDSIEIPRPRTYRQADDVNDEWVNRFDQANTSRALVLAELPLTGQTAG